MSERPILNKDLKSKTFRAYYYLKEELIAFCRTNGLQTSGGKLEITDRIAHFLDTGEILYKKTIIKPKTILTNITENTLIESNFICSEVHRTFFKEKIGKRFSFNVVFQECLRSNPGKTYAQSIEAYHQILVDKKSSKTTIDKQFEYNTYIRDFFEDNKGSSLGNAIQCWKYKKGHEGHNCYDKEDLVALNK